MEYKKNFSSLFPAIFEFMSKEGTNSHNNGSAVMLYLYIAHHFCLTNKKSIAITYKEFESGMATDAGLGFCKSTINNAIKRLQELGILQVKQRKFRQNREHRLSNLYRPLLPVYSTSGSLEIQRFCLISGPYENDDEYENQTEKVRSENQTEYENQTEKVRSENQSVYYYSNNNNNIRGPKSPLIISSDTNPLDLKNNPSSKLPLFDIPGKTDSTPVSPDKFQVLVTTLWNRLGELNKLSPTSSPKGWKQTIQRYIIGGIDYSRFHRVLLWYCDHIGSDYIPVAYSAKTFCDKFFGIEAAMQRELNKDALTLDNMQEAAPQPLAPPDTEEIRRHHRASIEHLL